VFQEDDDQRARPLGKADGFLEKEHSTKHVYFNDGKAGG